MTKVFKGRTAPTDNITHSDIWFEEDCVTEIINKKETITIKCPRCGSEWKVSKCLYNSDDDMSCWMCGEIY